MKKGLSSLIRSKAALLSIVLVIGFLTVMLSLMATRGDSSEYVLFKDRTDVFMDFFNSVYDTVPEDPYRDRGVIYPALSYVFYGAVKDCVPLVFTFEQGAGISQSQIAQWLLVYFVLTGSVILLYGLKSIGKNYVLPVLLLLSAPFMYLVERGNMLLMTVAFTSVFIAFYRHPRAIVREIAYISLAIAAATKIYPALFGLLLLRDRDWKGTRHCVFWGILLFVVPFFKWGGLEDIGIMFYNILHNGNSSIRVGFGEKLNFSNTFRMLAAYTNWSGFDTLAQYSPVICVLLLAPAMMFSREKWKAVLATAVFCIAFPGFSYMYSAVLLFPAVILFVEAEFKKSDYLYLFLLAVPLVPWMADLSGVLPRLAAADAEAIFTLTTGSVFSSFALLGLAVCLEIDAVGQIVRRLRGRGAVCKADES